MKPARILPDGSVEYVLRWLKYHRNKAAETAWARIVGPAAFAHAAADSAWSKLQCDPDTEVLTSRPTM
jgi:hypothetical protein